MPSSVDFDNGSQLFNIHLDAEGNLNFNANNTNGNGNTKIKVSDDSGTIDIGGSGQFGNLQLKDPSDGNTIFIGASESSADMLMGGSGGRAGRLQLFDSAGLNTIDLEGGPGVLSLGTNGEDGDLLIFDNTGSATIVMNGDPGSIRCVSLTETSDMRLKKGIAPLINALDKILTMRGVRYQWKQERTQSTESSEVTEIGFIGQEMEAVCPELVATDMEGYKSLNYSRLTPILVEAIKEQQNLIQQQMSALQDAIQRIAEIEMNLETKSG